MTIYQWSQVSQLIRFKINAFDAKLDDDAEAEMEDSRPGTMKQGGSFKLGHIVLGSVQKPTSFEQVSEAHNDDLAFSHFYRRFSDFLRTQYSSDYGDLNSKKFKVRFTIIWAHS